MSDWCLIESDPGVFTELVDTIGVKGVEFEEVYDVDMISKDAHGLIFLFKWQGAKEPREVVSYPPAGLFFAKQVITNACATQAILSVIMNSKVKTLGKNLEEFKSFTMELDPEMKGLAISNSDIIRCAHNSFARQSSFDFVKDDKDEKDDAFHFVGYVPYQGKVYELDGLQSGPIEIGKIDGENWIDTVKPEIRRRMDKYQTEGSGEIRFNLLSISDDPAYATEVQILKKRLLRQRANIKMVSFGEDVELDDEVDEDEVDTEGVMEIEELSDDVADLKKVADGCVEEIKNLKDSIAEVTKKKESWIKENARRRHDYVPFLLCAMKHLAKNGKLVDAYNKGKEKTQAENESKQAEKKAKTEEAK